MAPLQPPAPTRDPDRLREDSARSGADASDSTTQPHSPPQPLEATTSEPPIGTADSLRLGVLVPAEDDLRRATGVLAALARRAQSRSSSTPEIGLAGVRVAQERLASLLSLVDRIRVQGAGLAGVVDRLLTTGVRDLEEAAELADTTQTWRLLQDFARDAPRPYRVTGVDGVAVSAVSVDPAALRLGERSLVVDQVHGLIWRDGARIHLSRKPVLSRFLHLLASRVGRDVSQDDLADALWGVPYHPIRHGPSVFNHAMRIRRLIGDETRTILQTVQDGYRLVPASDFLLVEWAPTTEQRS